MYPNNRSGGNSCLPTVQWQHSEKFTGIFCIRCNMRGSLHIFLLKHDKVDALCYFLSLHYLKKMPKLVNILHSEEGQFLTNRAGRDAQGEFVWDGEKLIHASRVSVSEVSLRLWLSLYNNPWSWVTIILQLYGNQSREAVYVTQKLKHSQKKSELVKLLYKYIKKKTPLQVNFSNLVWIHKCEGRRKDTPPLRHTTSCL